MIQRGSIVLVALKGDYGKARPAVVVQSDSALELASVVVCPMTSHPEDAAILRIPVDPSDQNGLLLRSYVMVEKVAGTRRSRLGQPIGRLEDDAMAKVTNALAVLLDLV